MYLPYKEDSRREREREREMGSVATEKPHAVCIPFPAQGHINPMLKLAKLLHYKGFHITFVHTEFNYNRILSSSGPSSLTGLDDFRFATIPDGLPPTDDFENQDLKSLCISIQTNFSAPFHDLVTGLNDASSSVPPVTCIVSDAVMTFTVDTSKELGITNVFFYSSSACGTLGVLHYKQLIQRGLTPFKSESDFTNGYLDTSVDWLPGLKNMRLKDIPSFIRTTDPNDFFLNFLKDACESTSEASAAIINTFNDLEQQVLEVMSLMVPPLYAVGPLCLLSGQMHESPLASLHSSLWKEELDCLEWLEGREARSVVYVNFGSLTVLTTGQLIEFAWGLANSGYDFLWVIRSDLVVGEFSVLPQEFLTETKDRGLLASWCPQEQVLLHPSIGGFLTHGGWNSTLESICGGVPMICWPFFGDQMTNCRYMYTEWGIGREINNDVKREEVESLVRELMGGEKGKEMSRRALQWKKSATKATRSDGQSFLNFERVVKEVLLQSK